MSQGPGKDYMALMVHTMTDLLDFKSWANNLHQRGRFFLKDS